MQPPPSFCWQHMEALFFFFFFFSLFSFTFLLPLSSDLSSSSWSFCSFFSRISSCPSSSFSTCLSVSFLFYSTSVIPFTVPTSFLQDKSSSSCFFVFASCFLSLASCFFRSSSCSLFSSSSFFNFIPQVSCSLASSAFVSFTTV